MSTITDSYRRMHVSEVRDITVSEVVTADGTAQRSIRIAGTPEVNGEPTEILELILESEDAGDLEMQAPVQRY